MDEVETGAAVGCMKGYQTGCKFAAKGWSVTTIRRSWSVGEDAVMSAFAAVDSLILEDGLDPAALAVATRPSR